MARLGRAFPAHPTLTRTSLLAAAAPGAATDSAPASDTAAVRVTLGRTASDTAPASDVAAPSFPRTATDSAPAADTAVMVRVLAGRTAGDTAHASDTAARAVLALTRAPTDVAGASDSIGPPVVVRATNASPNWPLMGFDVDFTSGPPYVPGGLRSSINASYRRLWVRKWSVDRGRQYELDQVQAGQATLEIPDPNELLNPDNPSSPFNDSASGYQVTPYRAMRIWGMWPNQPGSGNIICTTVDTSFDPGFETGTGGWTPVSAATHGTSAVQSTVQAWEGTHSLLVTQAATGSSYGVVHAFPTTPGLTYSFSAYVFPTGGCSVQAQVVDALGNITTSNVATVQNAWTRVSVTWLTADTLEPVTIYGTGTTTPTFYVDATMLEFGSVLHPYTASGPTLYPIFTGYVERYPTTYDMAGTRAHRPLVAVDGLAILSRTAISQSYDATVLADSPQVYLPMTTTKPPVTGADLGDGLGQGLSGGAVPYFNLSKSGSFSWGSDSHPDGTPALAITGQNANQPPTQFATASYSEMIVQGSTITVNPQAGFTWAAWLKWSSGTAQSATFETLQPGNPYGLNQNVPLVGALNFGVGLGIAYNPDGNNFQYFAPPGINVYAPDGEWHYLYQTIQGTACEVGWDAVGLPNSSTVVTASNIAFNTFYCEASAQYAVAQAQNSQGRVALFSSVLTAAQLVAHYQRGVGYITELSGARVLRLLAQYWAGGWSVASGAAQMAPDFSYDTRSTSGAGQGQQRVMLDVLQEIQETERGLVYVSAGGSVVFEDRLTRYRNQSPLWVFGENPAGANPVEWPYQDVKFDHDPTYTFSQANLSSYSNNAFPAITNQGTQAKYGQRILTQTVQVNQDFDLTQAGIFYLQRYGTPKTRVSSLVLKPSANPALWPVILSLEISQRVTVRRRTPNLTTSGDYYVEKISHRVDSESSDWQTELQLSPVFNPVAWVCGDSTYGVLGTSTIPVY